MATIVGIPWTASGSRPSPAMLSEAQAARLLVIAPPPTQTLAVDEKLWQGVKGWLVGAAVDTRSLESLKSEVLRVSQFPEPLQRPTIAEAMEDYWAFSRVVDELIVPAPPTVSAGLPQEKLEWLRGNLQNTRRAGTSWVSISTEPLPGWHEQIRRAQQIVDRRRKSWIRPTRCNCDCKWQKQWPLGLKVSVSFYPAAGRQWQRAAGARRGHAHDQSRSETDRSLGEWRSDRSHSTNESP